LFVVLINQIFYNLERDALRALILVKG